jgi:copper(I)-binding protein
MLYGLSADVKAGDRVPVTLTFRSGARVDTMAEARAPAAAAPGGGGHRH